MSFKYITIPVDRNFSTEYTMIPLDSIATFTYQENDKVNILTRDGSAYSINVHRIVYSEAPNVGDALLCFKEYVGQMREQQGDMV